MSKVFLRLQHEEYYYRLALNLLISYRMANNALLFCVITDRENLYVGEFDEVVFLDNPSNSYLDKLKIYPYLLFNRNIILDVDS